MVLMFFNVWERGNPKKTPHAWASGECLKFRGSQPRSFMYRCLRRLSRDQQSWFICSSDHLAGKAGTVCCLGLYGKSLQNPALGKPRGGGGVERGGPERAILRPSSPS